MSYTEIEFFNQSAIIDKPIFVTLVITLNRSRLRVGLTLRKINEKLSVTIIVEQIRLRASSKSGRFIKLYFKPTR